MKKQFIQSLLKRINPDNKRIMIVQSVYSLENKKIGGMKNLKLYLINFLLIC